MKRFATFLGAVAAVGALVTPAAGQAAHVSRAFADVDAKVTSCHEPLGCGRVDYVHLHLSAYDRDPIAAGGQSGDTGSVTCEPIAADSVCPIVSPLAVEWVQITSGSDVEAGVAAVPFAQGPETLFSFHDGGAPGNRVTGPDFPYFALLGIGGTGVLVTPTRDYITSFRAGGVTSYWSVLDGNVTIR